MRGAYRGEAADRRRLASCARISSRNLLKARFGAQVQDLTSVWRRRAGRRQGRGGRSRILRQDHRDLDTVSANQARRRAASNCRRGSTRRHHRGADAALPAGRINGGVVKITELAGNQITGTTIRRSPRPTRRQPALGHRDLRQARRKSPGQRPRDPLARDSRAKGIVNRVQLVFLHFGRLARARARRHQGRPRRIGADAAGHAGSAFRSASRRPFILRNSHQEPLHRDHRSQHQQSRGGTLDRLRAAWPCDVPQLLRPAAFGAAGRRPGAGAPRAADHHHRVARRAAGGAALDQGGGAGVGASHQQAVFHHVLPLAMPGIMTGTIIGMAHALGETAPLLMIGMVAFIVEVPHRHHRCRDRAAGTDLSVVRFAGDRVPGEDGGAQSSCFWCSCS